MRQTLHKFITREAASTGGLKPELRLSSSMHKVLQNLADGREPFCANGTRMALIKRGLVTADMQLTPAGKVALHAYGNALR
jgi:hypothetical protein